VHYGPSRTPRQAKNAKKQLLPRHHGGKCRFALAPSGFDAGKRHMNPDCLC